MATQKDFRVKNGIVVAGNAELTGLLYPTSDGTNRQVIMTDGAGILSFEDLDTLHTSATNQTGSTILKGTPVYQTGTSGNAMTVAPADASSSSTMPAVGVLEQDLASGATGFVIHMGQISGVDTSAFSEGDTIYVAVGGGYTNTPPTGESNLIQNLGRVTKVHASNGGGVVMGAGRANATPNLNDGNIFIGNASNQAVTATLNLNLLGDVDLSTAPTDGQTIIWDAANSKFIAGDSAGAFVDLSDTPGTFGTAGQAVIVNGTADGLVFGDVTADFVGLSDSPSSYTSNAGRVVKVNATEDGVDFGDIVTGSSQREYFTGDGTTTDFTLANPYSSTNGFIVFVNGVIQKEGSGEDYQYVNGTTLSFNAAPSNTSEIFVYGITPIAQNVPVDGSVTAAKLAVSAYTRDTFSGDGSTTAFTLTRDPGSVYSPLVFVDGVIQDPVTGYTLSGTTLTFTFTPTTGTDNILVVYGPTLTAGTVSDGSITFAKLAPGNFSHQVETGDGTTTDFSLDQNTVSESHIIVTVAGVPQSPDGTSYTVTNNGNTLSFSAAPANAAKIVIRYYASAAYSAPANNTVTTASIQDGAVTPAKLDREYATKGTSIALSIALG